MIYGILSSLSINDIITLSKYIGKLQHINSDHHTKNNYFNNSLKSW